MMDSDNGDVVGGVGSYASPSGHGVAMAWQSETAASSRAAPAHRDMDSFAWASVSRSASAAARGEHLLPPPPANGFHAPQAAAVFERFSANSGVLELSGGSSGSKRRRRPDEMDGTDQEKASNASADSAGETKRSSKDAHGGGVAAGESKGKGAKGAGDGEPRKEGYVHIRARSGQATNSHSLAEKLRREKISERMKLLQDLVPGCSKVTGKAVMLDEIINYVQSLQRQVEFLSMKLSTVNPRLDRNIESLIAEHILPFHWTPSTAPIGFSFSHEMMPKPSQSGMLQGGVHGMVNPDVLRTVVQAQLNESDAFREPAPIGFSFSHEMMPKPSQPGMLQGGVHGMVNPDVFRTVVQAQLNESDAFREPASQIHHTLDGSSFHDTAQMAWPDQDGFHHM